ncbi:MAG: hypothetical protein ABIZ82_03370 [Candidatus Tumulicola sp.]
MLNLRTSNAAAGRASSSGYQQLYAFKGTPDGAGPLAGLTVVKGKLYGTTLNGSKNYCGAIGARANGTERAGAFLADALSD